MRIAGKSIEREFSTVTIPRQKGNIQIKVWSLPIGYKRQYAEIFPRPTPPKREIHDKKNGVTDKIEWDDPNYVRLMNEWEDLQNYYLIFRVMDGADGNEFDTKQIGNPADLRALKEEFLKSGLSEGDCALIVKAALKASNVDQAEVAKAVENF